jgi:hypothetical protein
MGSEMGVRPFSARSDAGVLDIVIEREFDFASLHRDWAVSILSQHPGPFTRVRLDMAKCGRVCSTFYAGLMQLHFAYNAKGTSPITLVKPDPRMIANLKSLRLEPYFHIES